jgi:hypothetical protein
MAARQKDAALRQLDLAGREHVGGSMCFDEEMAQARAQNLEYRLLGRCLAIENGRHAVLPVRTV